MKPIDEIIKIARSLSRVDKSRRESFNRRTRCRRLKKLLKYLEKRIASAAGTNISYDCRESKWKFSGWQYLTLGHSVPENIHESSAGSVRYGLRVWNHVWNCASTSCTNVKSLLENVHENGACRVKFSLLRMTRLIQIAVIQQSHQDRW